MPAGPAAGIDLHRWYAEAAALDVLGSADHLPPVLSGHNAYWMWGAGRASDQTVLVVDTLGWLRAYFASCRLLTIYHAVKGHPELPGDGHENGPLVAIRSAR
jgi:hypothetical protein